MDDLAGIDFNTSSKQPEVTRKANPSHTYASLQPAISPATSGRSTPLLATKQHESTPSLRTRPAAKTTHADSFSGLVALNAAKKQDTLSLQERQSKLLEEKIRQRLEQQSAFDSHFGSSASFNIGQQEQKGSGILQNKSQIANTHSTAPTNTTSSNNRVREDGTLAQGRQLSQKDDDDILSAFNAATPVDQSSYLPAPEPKTHETPLGREKEDNEQNASDRKEKDQHLNMEVVDDDPFDLHTLTAAKDRKTGTTNNGDKFDDILGALGEPVAKSATNQTQALKKHRNADDSKATSSKGTLQDKAISELVEMGFSIDQAKDALRQTDDGNNVECAVHYLLTKAHQESRHKSGNNEVKVSNANQRGNDQIQQTNETGDVDAAQFASQVGNNIIKSANYLWRSGQKKVQRAVSELQQESDTSRPKWMREPPTRTRSETLQESEKRRRESRNPSLQDNPNHNKDVSFTDEALMLEPNGAKSSTRRSNKERTSTRNEVPANPMVRSITDTSQQHPTHNLRGTRPSTQRNGQSSLSLARPSKNSVEQESANAYISPARRKDRVHQSANNTAQRHKRFPESSQAQLQQSNSVHPGHDNSKSISRRLDKDDPKPVKFATKPKSSEPKPRSIPQTSNEALVSSTSHRQKGNDAYKRGDHNSAYELYSRAVSTLPDRHPILIALFCNRALTSTKMGDPKAAIVDVDSALDIIGTAKGQGEIISLGPMEESKDMKELYGKALMRKAEALEIMEKWSDASLVWQEAIQSGAGGSISIQGRDRCEKARRPAVPIATKPKTTTAGRSSLSKTSAVADLSGESGGMDSEAVKKLRAANAAEKRSDDERFALADQVDSRLAAWKGSKSDNLRALLGSLDKVLWAGADWKPVGMSDLVMANKVKIIYMKAIAKVHPDKVSFAFSLQRDSNYITDINCLNRFLLMLVPNNA